MYYSAIVLLAIFILIIENYDILFRRAEGAEHTRWELYRRFLVVILSFYGTDMLWGIIEQMKLSRLLYIDTTVYFITLAGTVYHWTQFAVTYLDDDSIYGRILSQIGKLFFIFYMLSISANLFFPVLFTVDEHCVYETKPLRHMMLVLQIFILVLLAIYAFAKMVRQQENRTYSQRYRTIGVFGLIIATFLIIQIWFPYLPLYTIAYMLGTSILRTFVVNNEIEEYRNEIKDAAERERRKEEELKIARVLAYRDPLTGVKSKHAYVEYESRKDRQIQEKTVVQFALALFDVNGLKLVNDTLGHNAGDQLIIDSSSIICNTFKHSPVFRIGGDEFAALLEGEDYNNRHALIGQFKRRMECPQCPDQPMIAMGIANYLPGQDESFHSVLIRADKDMYEHKRELKSLDQHKMVR